MNAGGALHALLRYARRHRTALACSLVLSLLAGGTGLALPLVTQTVLDSLSTGGGVGRAVAVLAVLLIVEGALRGLNA